MTYWLISDTHFNHQNIEKWNERRGDWQDKLWESIRQIPKGDVLIHLGDICIGNDLAIHEGISALQCKRILIRGNHDKKSHTWYLEHGWDFVCDGLELMFCGHYLHLTHRPSRPQGNTTWNIHGHTHGNMHRSEEYLDFYSTEYHVDISPELSGFTAQRLDHILRCK